MKAFFKKIIDNLIYFESFFYTNRNRSDKKKILILRKDGLGDCILFYPLLSHYRKFFSDYDITLIFPKYFKDLSPILKEMNSVIWFDHKKFSSNFFYRRSFLIKLRTAGYDIAIYPVFSRESIGDFMMKMTRAREVFGINGDSSIQGVKNQIEGNRVYTKLIEISDEIKSEFERNIHFTEKLLNKKIIVDFPTIDATCLDDSNAKSLMVKNGLNENGYVIVFPGSGANYKIWETNKFAKCIDHIFSKNMIPVICGSMDERSLVKEICDKCNNKNKVVNLAGETDLGTLCHLLYKSKFYFGSDTSILHLSVALGKESVGIVGSGSYERFYPYGNKNKNIALFDYESTKIYPLGRWDKIYSKDSKTHPSISAINVKQAILEIDKIINK